MTILKMTTMIDMITTTTVNKDASLLHVHYVPSRMNVDTHSMAGKNCPLSIIFGVQVP